MPLQYQRAVSPGTGYSEEEDDGDGMGTYHGFCSTAGYGIRPPEATHLAWVTHGWCYWIEGPNKESLDYAVSELHRYLQSTVWFSQNPYTIELFIPAAEHRAV